MNSGFLGEGKFAFGNSQSLAKNLCMCKKNFHKKLPLAFVSDSRSTGIPSQGQVQTCKASKKSKNLLNLDYKSQRQYRGNKDDRIIYALFTNNKYTNLPFVRHRWLTEAIIKVKL